MDKRNPIKERTQLRNRKVCDLRKQGMTYTEISKLFGISHQRANQIYGTHVKHLKDSKQHRDKKRNEF